MGSSFKSPYVLGIFGVVGLVGTVKVIGPMRIAKFFWFRSPAQRQGITNKQQKYADGQITDDPERPTRETRSTLWLRKGPISMEKITVQTIERLKASLEEMGQLIQERDALEAHLNLLKKMTDPKIGEIQAEEIKRLQARLEKQDQLLQEKTAALSSAEEAAMKQEQLIHDLLATNQRQREEIRQMKVAGRTSPDNEQISMLSPPASVNKVDNISVEEVVELLKMLNAHIEQAASLIASSIIYREPPISSKELEDVLNELIGYIGPRLCHDLRSKSKESSTELDYLITQIAVQGGLVNASKHIVNNGIPPSDGATSSGTHSDMLDVGQAVGQKAQPHTSAATSRAWEINQKFLTGIALKLRTAVGGSMQSGEDLPSQHREILDEIVKSSLALYKAINEDAEPTMELVPYTAPWDANFDPSRMEDTEGGETEHITQDTVVCTMELGLQCRKRNESGSREEWDVAMKTKVVLARTLEV